MPLNNVYSYIPEHHRQKSRPIMFAYYNIYSGNETSTCIFHKQKLKYNRINTTFNFHIYLDVCHGLFKFKFYRYSYILFSTINVFNND